MVRRISSNCWGRETVNNVTSNSGINNNKVINS